jgi:chaperonin GroES
MTIRPLHDRIFAKRVTPQAKTTGGLHIPENAKEKPMEAIVIAVGSGKVIENGTVVPTTVKSGDRILIGKYTGSEVTVDGEEHIIVGEDDVLAVLEGAE